MCWPHNAPASRARATSIRVPGAPELRQQFARPAGLEPATLGLEGRHPAGPPVLCENVRQNRFKGPTRGQFCSHRRRPGAVLTTSVHPIHTAQELVPEREWRFEPSLPHQRFRPVVPGVPPGAFNEQHPSNGPVSGLVDSTSLVASQPIARRGPATSATPCVSSTSSSTTSASTSRRARDACSPLD